MAGGDCDNDWGCIFCYFCLVFGADWRVFERKNIYENRAAKQKDTKEKIKNFAFKKWAQAKVTN